MTREQKLVEAAKANGETEVVFWTVTWRPGPVEKAFEARYPFLKLKVWDGSSQVEPKLKEEYKAGRYTPDVVVTGMYRMVRIKDDGVLQEYDYPNTQGWPNQPPHNFWRHHQLYTMSPMYNTNLVSPADVPKTWEDLNDSKWREKAIISVSGAGWLLYYAYLMGDVGAEGVNWDKSVEFWKEVVGTTKPQIGRGFKGPLEQLIVGDVNIMLVASGTTGLYSIKQGAPIDFAPFNVIPGEPYALAMPKNPPNPNAAQLLIDFLTTEEGSIIGADGLLSTTLHPEAAKKVWSNRYYESKGVEIKLMPMELWRGEDSAKSADLWVKEIVGVR
jgi:iron(III) transport system substrate-binding protein